MSIVESFFTITQTDVGSSNKLIKKPGSRHMNKGSLFGVNSSE